MKKENRRLRSSAAPKNEKTGAAKERQKISHLFSAFCLRPGPCRRPHLGRSPAVC